MSVLALIKNYQNSNQLKITKIIYKDKQNDTFKKS
jgi:hypothetical protein